MAATISESLTLSGASSNLSVGGTGAFTGNVSMGAGLTVSGASTLTGVVTFGAGKWHTGGSINRFHFAADGTSYWGGGDSLGTAGAIAHEWRNGAGATRMQLYGNGTLVMVGGIASGAGNGSFILGRDAYHYGTNGAGTGNVFTVGLDPADRLYFNANGKAIRIDSALTQTTVGAAGAAAALPSNPSGYEVKRVNGTDRAFPYYNV